MLMKISKVLLVLVLIGFFCPIACDGSGVDMLSDGIRHGEEELILVGAVLLLAAVAAAVGFISAFSGKTAQKMGPYPIISTIAVIIAFCLGVSYMGDIEFLIEFLDYGAYLMIGGSVLSLILALAARFSGQKDKPDTASETDHQK